MKPRKVITGHSREGTARFAALVVVPLLLFAACKRSQQPTYAVIPKGQAHIFWQTVHAGALAAAREANVEVAWNGPATEADFARQIAIIDDFINRHVDGILLAPTDRDALVPAIRRARQAGIPLSIFDSGANTEDYVSFVATDNYGGGVMAARRLGEILNKRGKVAMIAVMPGGASTLAREQGFKETLEKEFPEVKLVAWQFGMSDRARSLAVTEDVLTANPTLNGIFASNESSTVGAAQAVKARNLTAKVRIVGFDSSPSLVEDLRAGIIDSLVLQDPFQIGYQGLKTLLNQRAGRAPPKRLDLPPVLVTRENFDDPKVRQLLNPELERYLKE
ncbi:MAG: substrate-binding domain-containing protein [Acidobacteria bacterium]|nr:substrate-binding domain-containing protein [Acidobacteriota bacterium]